MKLLILALLPLFLFSQERAFAYKEKKNHFVFFVKKETEKAIQTPSGKKEQSYYKNGAISEAARFVTDDRIQIAFSTAPDLALFEKTFNLKRIATLRKNIHIFENRSSLDDVELCAKLWEEAGIEYARPLFKNKKRLQ
jgi:hypothetical protein